MSKQFSLKAQLKRVETAKEDKADKKAGIKEGSARDRIQDMKLAKRGKK